MDNRTVTNNSPQGITLQGRIIAGNGGSATVDVDALTLGEKHTLDGMRRATLATVSGGWTLGSDPLTGEAAQNASIAAATAAVSTEASARATAVSNETSRAESKEMKFYGGSVSIGVDGNVAMINGLLVDGQDIPRRGVVDCAADSTGGAAGNLSVTATTGRILGPDPTPGTRIAFRLETDASGNFAYSLTSAEGAGACVQTHDAGNAYDRQAVAFTT